MASQIKTLFIGMIGIVTFGLCYEESNSWTNHRIDRVVRLGPQLVITEHSLRILNTGKKQAAEYNFAIEPFVAYCYVQAFYNKEPLLSERFKEVDNMTSVVKIHLPTPIDPGDKISIFIETIHVFQIKPVDAYVIYHQIPTMMYEGTLYYYSIYETMWQSLKLVAQDGIRSYSNPSGTVNAGGTNLIYGPFSKFGTKLYEKILVFYGDHIPYLHMYLDREIDVSSLFGKLAVTETIKIQHAGAKLRGPYHVLPKTQQHQNRSAYENILFIIQTKLPTGTTSFWCYDDLGQIFSHKLTENYDHVALALKPRYPLLAGWKIIYKINYQLPSYEYLYKDKSKFLLQMNVIDHILDGMIIMNATTRIILPCFAKFESLQLPYGFTRDADSSVFGWFMKCSRQVINVKKYIALEDDIVPFQLNYELKTIPGISAIYLAALMEAMFLIIILVNRSSFNIEPNHITK